MSGELRNSLTKNIAIQKFEKDVLSEQSEDPYIGLLVKNSHEITAHIDIRGPISIQMCEEMSQFLAVFTTPNSWTRRDRESISLKV